MKKILITGSNGFIGKSLVELLGKNTDYEIIAKDRHSLDLLNTDKVKDFFDENKIDYIIHCATAGGGRLDPDVPRIFYENTKMFENLILFKDSYKLLITFGSGAEQREGEFPLNYYGLSKKYITEKIKQQKLNSVVLRLWGCFGKYEGSERFIKNNLKRYRSHQSLVIHQNKFMDFFYVNDLIPILEYFLNIDGYNLMFKEVDCKYKETLSLFNILNLINKLGEHEMKIEVENPGSTSYKGEYSLFLDNYKFIGLEEGIKQMYSEL